MPHHQLPLSSSPEAHPSPSWNTPDINIGKTANEDGSQLQVNVLRRNTGNKDSVSYERIFLMASDNPSQAYQKIEFKTRSGKKIVHRASRILGNRGNRKGKIHFCKVLPRISSDTENMIFEEPGEPTIVCIKEIYRNKGDGEQHVRLGSRKSLRETIAVMQARVQENHKENHYNETRAMQEIGTNSDDNIMHCVEALINMKSVFLVMPDADNGQLRRTRMDEKDARHQFRKILTNLEYLHKRRVCHVDLKHDNIVVNGKDDRTKLIDFGMSLKIPHNGTERFLIESRGYCGTPEYMAPEMLETRNYDGFAIDVWALGIVLFYLLTGEFLYDGEGLPIVEDKYNSNGELVKYANLDYQHLIVHECLNPTEDARNRNDHYLALCDLYSPKLRRLKRKIRAVKCLSSDARKLLSGMLKVDMRSRFKTEDIAQHSWLN